MDARERRRSAPVTAVMLALFSAAVLSGRPLAVSGESTVASGSVAGRAAAALEERSRAADSEILAMDAALDREARLMDSLAREVEGLGSEGAGSAEGPRVGRRAENGTGERRHHQHHQHHQHHSHHGHHPRHFDGEDDMPAGEAMLEEERRFGNATDEWARDCSPACEGSEECVDGACRKKCMKPADCDDACCELHRKVCMPKAGDSCEDKCNDDHDCDGTHFCIQSGGMLGLGGSKVCQKKCHGLADCEAGSCCVIGEVSEAGLKKVCQAKKKEADVCQEWCNVDADCRAYTNGAFKKCDNSKRGGMFGGEKYGRCIKNCALHADCAAEGGCCDHATGACVPKASKSETCGPQKCESDDHCTETPGHVCDARSRTCRASCKDQACPAGECCNAVAGGICEPKVGDTCTRECKTDEHCELFGSNLGCDRREAGFTNFSGTGVCTAKCKKNTDCGEDSCCDHVSGFCSPRTPGVETCGPQKCDRTDHCENEGFTCHNHRCLPSCADGKECPAGLCCHLKGRYCAKWDHADECADECEKNEDCFMGANGKPQVCELPGGVLSAFAGLGHCRQACELNSDCGDSQCCDHKNGFCVAKETETCPRQWCERDDQCTEQPGQRCAAASKQCFTSCRETACPATDCCSPSTKLCEPKADPDQVCPTQAKSGLFDGLLGGQAEVECESDSDGKCNIEMDQRCYFDPKAKVGSKGTCRTRCAASSDCEPNKECCNMNLHLCFKKAGTCADHEAANRTHELSHAAGLGGYYTEEDLNNDEDISPEEVQRIKHETGSCTMKSDCNVGVTEKALLEDCFLGKCIKQAICRIHKTDSCEELVPRDGLKCWMFFTCDGDECTSCAGSEEAEHCVKGESEQRCTQCDAASAENVCGKGHYCDNGACKPKCRRDHDCMPKGLLVSKDRAIDNPFSCVLDSGVWGRCQLREDPKHVECHADADCNPGVVNKKHFKEFCWKKNERDAAGTCFIKGMCTGHLAAGGKCENQAFHTVACQSYFECDHCGDELRCSQCGASEVEGGMLPGLEAVLRNAAEDARFKCKPTAECTGEGWVAAGSTPVRPCEKCAENKDCGGGHYCNADTGACLPQCTNDHHCLAGEKCQKPLGRTTGKCIKDAPGTIDLQLGKCKRDSECNPGIERPEDYVEECVEVDGLGLCFKKEMCKGLKVPSCAVAPRKGQCVTMFSCGPACSEAAEHGEQACHACQDPSVSVPDFCSEWSCDEHTEFCKQCTGANECGSGHYCKDGGCFPMCDDDEHCEASERCVKSSPSAALGRCEPDPDARTHLTEGSDFCRGRKVDDCQQQAHVHLDDATCEDLFTCTNCGGLALIGASRTCNPCKPQVFSKRTEDVIFDSRDADEDYSSSAYKGRCEDWKCESVSQCRECVEDGNCRHFNTEVEQFYCHKNKLLDGSFEKVGGCVPKCERDDDCFRNEVCFKSGNKGYQTLGKCQHKDLVVSPSAPFCEGEEADCDDLQPDEAGLCGTKFWSCGCGGGVCHQCVEADPITESGVTKNQCKGWSCSEGPESACRKCTGDGQCGPGRECHEGGCRRKANWAADEATDFGHKVKPKGPHHPHSPSQGDVDEVIDEMEEHSTSVLPEDREEESSTSFNAEDLEEHSTSVTPEDSEERSTSLSPEEREEESSTSLSAEEREEPSTSLHPGELGRPDLSRSSETEVLLPSEERDEGIVTEEVPVRLNTGGAGSGGILSGLTVKEEPTGLVVETVAAEGPIAAWNKAHPEQPIAPGFLITAVGGQTEGLKAALRQKKLLTVTVREGEPVSANLERLGTEEPLGVTLEVREGKLVVSAVQEGESSCIGRWNKENPTKAVRKGMIVAEVNGVEGDPEAMKRAFDGAGEVLDDPRLSKASKNNAGITMVVDDEEEHSTSITPEDSEEHSTSLSPEEREEASSTSLSAEEREEASSTSLSAEDREEDRSTSLNPAEREHSGKSGLVQLREGSDAFLIDVDFEAPTFEATLDGSGGGDSSEAVKPGFEWKIEGGELVITSVDAQGAMATWNSGDHDAFKVEPGMTLHSVNGKTVPEEMVAELEAPGVLDLKIKAVVAPEIVENLNSGGVTRETVDEDATVEDLATNEELATGMTGGNGVVLTGATCNEDSCSGEGKQCRGPADSQRCTTAPLAENEPCEWYPAGGRHECAGDLACRGPQGAKRCLPPLAADKPCDGGSPAFAEECEPGLFCSSSSNTCKDRLVEGDGCNLDGKAGCGEGNDLYCMVKMGRDAEVSDAVDLTAFVHPKSCRGLRQANEDCEPHTDWSECDPDNGAACRLTTPGSPAKCLTKLPMGSPCEAHDNGAEDCGPGGRCSPKTRLCEECVSEGLTCNATMECCEDHACNPASKTCVKVLGEGHACEISTYGSKKFFVAGAKPTWSACGAGLVCVEGKCKPECAKEMQFCEKAEECCKAEDGHAAMCLGRSGEKECRHEKLQKGENCEYDKDSDPCSDKLGEDLRCRGLPLLKTCTTPLGLGEGCEHASDCDSGEDGFVSCRGPPGAKKCSEPLKANDPCSPVKGECGPDLTCNKKSLRCEGTCLLENAACGKNTSLSCCGAAPYCVGPPGEKTCRREKVQLGDRCERHTFGMGVFLPSSVPSSECDSQVKAADEDAGPKSIDCRGPKGAKTCTAGPQPLGAGCEPHMFSNECQKKLTCSKEANECQTCIPTEQQCSILPLSRQCCEGTKCFHDTKLCTEAKPRDAECKSHTLWDECEADHKCKNNKCAPVCHREAEACELGGMGCCGGLRCLGPDGEKTCQAAELTKDAPCAYQPKKKNECEKGLFCVGHKDAKRCQVLLGDGDECEVHEDGFNECDEKQGLACRGQAGAKRCRKLLEDGEPCEPIKGSIFSLTKKSECQKGLTCHPTSLECTACIKSGEDCEEVGDLGCCGQERCLGPKGKKTCRAAEGLEAGEACESKFTFMGLRQGECGKHLECKGGKCVATCSHLEEPCGGGGLGCCSGDGKNLVCRGAVGQKRCTDATLKEDEACESFLVGGLKGAWNKLTQKKSECDKHLVCDPKSSVCVAKILNTGEKCEGTAEGMVCNEAAGEQCRGALGQKTCREPIPAGEVCDSTAKIAPGQPGECAQGYACQGNKCVPTAVCCACSNGQILWSASPTCDQCPNRQTLTLFAVPPECGEQSSDVASCSAKCGEGYGAVLDFADQGCNSKSAQTCMQKGEKFCVWLGASARPSCQARLKVSTCLAHQDCGACVARGCAWLHWAGACAAADLQPEVGFNMAIMDEAKCDKDAYVKGIGGSMSDDVKDCLASLKGESVEDPWQCVSLGVRSALSAFLAPSEEDSIEDMDSDELSALPIRSKQSPGVMLERALRSRRLRRLRRPSATGGWQSLRDVSGFWRAGRRHLHARQRGRRVWLTGTALGQRHAVGWLTPARRGGRVWLHVRQNGKLRRARVGSSRIVFEDEPSAFVRVHRGRGMARRERLQHQRRLASRAGRRGCRELWGHGAGHHCRYRHSGLQELASSAAAGAFGKKKSKKNKNKKGKRGGQWWEENSITKHGFLLCRVLRRRAVEKGMQLKEGDCEATDYLGNEELGRLRESEDFSESLAAGSIRTMDGAFYASTADGKFLMVRLMKKDPPKKLLEMIKGDKLYKHLQSFQESLIMKPLGIFRIELPKTLFPKDKDFTIVLFKSPLAGASMEYFLKPDDTGLVKWREFRENVKEQQFASEQGGEACQAVIRNIGRDGAFLEQFRPSSVFGGACLGFDFMVGSGADIDECGDAHNCQKISDSEFMSFAITNFWEEADEGKMMKELAKEGTWVKGTQKMVKMMCGLSTNAQSDEWYKGLKAKFPDFQEDNPIYSDVNRCMKFGTGEDESDEQGAKLACMDSIEREVIADILENRVETLPAALLDLAPPPQRQALRPLAGAGGPQGLGDLSGQWREGRHGHRGGAVLELKHRGSQLSIAGAQGRAVGVLRPARQPGHAVLRLRWPHGEVGRQARVTARRIVFEDGTVLTRAPPRFTRGEALVELRRRGQVQGDDIEKWSMKRLEPAMCKMVHEKVTGKGTTCWDQAQAKKKELPCEVHYYGGEAFAELRQSDAQPGGQGDVAAEMKESFGKGVLKDYAWAFDKSSKRKYQTTQDGKFMLLFEEEGDGKSHAESLMELVKGGKDADKLPLAEHFRHNPNSILQRVYGVFRIHMFKGKVEDINCDGMLKWVNTKDTWVTIMRAPTYGFFQTLPASTYKKIYEMNVDKDKALGDDNLLGTKKDFEDSQEPQIMLTQDQCSGIDKSMAVDMAYLDGWRRKGFSVQMSVGVGKKDELPLCPESYLNTGCYESTRAGGGGKSAGKAASDDDEEVPEPTKAPKKAEADEGSPGKTGLLEVMSLRDDGSFTEVRDRSRGGRAQRRHHHRRVSSMAQTSQGTGVARTRAPGDDHVYTLAVVNYWQSSQWAVTKWLKKKLGKDTFGGRTQEMMMDKCGGGSVMLAAVNDGSDGEDDETAMADQKTVQNDSGKKQGSSKWLLFGGLAVLAIVLIGGFYYISSQSSEDDDEEKKRGPPPPAAPMPPMGGTMMPQSMGTPQAAGVQYGQAGMMPDPGMQMQGGMMMTEMQMQQGGMVMMQDPSMGGMQMQDPSMMGGMQMQGPPMGGGMGGMQMQGAEMVSMTSALPMGAEASRVGPPEDTTDYARPRVPEDDR